MNNVELISLDLDGTLIDSEHKVTQRNIDVINEVISKNIPVILNSGRHYKSLKQYVDFLDLQTPVICNNGARVVDAKRDTSIMQINIPAAITQNILMECRSFNWSAAISLNDVVYIDDISPELQKLFDKGYAFDCEKLGDDLYAGNLIADNIVLFVDERKSLDIKKHLLRKFSLDVSVMVSMPNCIDVINNSAGKGKTLLKIAEKYYGVSAANILAVGDSDNDIDMFINVGISVAMDNATNYVKNYAKHVTLSNNQSGVAEAIGKFCFISQ